MFFFFSVIFPLGMFFLYAGIFARSNPRAVSYFLGPVIAFNVMGSFWGLSATLVMFREQGILRRFHVTPVTSTDMLASSLLANYVLTIPTVSIEVFLARFIFHVPSLGNLFSLAILVTVGTVSFGSLGLVVASVTNTMQETQVLNQIIWLPLIFLSGATFPLAYLPNSVQHFGLFLPAKSIRSQVCFLVRRPNLLAICHFFSSFTSAIHKLLYLSIPPKHGSLAPYGNGTIRHLEPA